MMKKAFAVAALVCCSAAAQASEGGYWGGVGGIMNVDIDGDNPFNAGVRAGYNWASGWGVEGELTGSLADGKAEYRYWGGNYGVDYSITTLAAYGTYRSSGQIYFKGKLGVLSETVKFSDDGDSYSESDSGLSLGLGAGFNLSDNLNLEAEYTVVEEDVGFFSGSLVFRF
ncbi:porin family protein [Microbulbifer pacificus]|uniref:Porin family protein n=1 Tax=Microbulbifer pacificus TaxID=407164 RepID=A0AAU0MWJ0_9GAMM|nr:porin family protein [Microbulbifer pacificus]WOX04544.1 porin family protein [Microbulbifer pacificus]